VTEARTILVVDDDHELRAGLETVLRKRGYRTLSAEDGQEARDLIDRQRLDLVILDMMMPHWGGFAVLEHFQGKPDAPPFIMITANQGEKHKTYAEKVGVIDYIHKPFPMERLLEGVDRALRTPAPPEEEAVARPVVRCRCKNCGARIKAPIRLMGETKSCPRCRLPLVILPEPPEDEGPVLAADDVLPRPSPGPRR
jgi:DNA-binding response OmpR family regulator